MWVKRGKQTRAGILYLREVAVTVLSIKGLGLAFVGGVKG